MRSCSPWNQPGAPTRLVWVLFGSLLAATAAGQPATREPHIGYLFPAGGKQGTVVRISAGGQYLRGAGSVLVSGDGVAASVVRYVEPIRPNQYQVLGKRLRELAAGKRTNLIDPLTTSAADSLPQRREPGKPPGAARSQAPDRQQTDPKKPSANQDDDMTLPDHPTLRYLETLTPRELQVVSKDLMNRNKRQPNQQIAETVVIDVTIARDALPGDREIRIATAAGLTNPMRFQVGQLPEVTEHEPNNPDWPEVKDVILPATLNGQITPGDVDRFRFKAQARQKLVIDVRARHLVPYLADAVPGWFQATVTLSDSKGKELAFADDYRFNPDPVLFYQIPGDDEYCLEIRDAIYRGREDFVYRVSVGEQPFITGMYPLGGRSGVATTAWVTGWNLGLDQVKLDTTPGAQVVRQAALRGKQWVSNPIAYAVGTLPETYEVEPNNEISGRLKALEFPVVVNGYVEKEGDIDVFRVRGHVGDKLVAEVHARRLGSPLDSLLRLCDATGTVLAHNDDREDKEMGLLTHHADSYLTATLPKDGDYYLRLSDTQNHGGSVYGYRLHVGPPRPDFSLRVTPSSINLPFGRTATITVFALRKDGFEGDIQVALKDDTGNYRLGGAIIPAGRDRVRMTLTALVPPSRPVPLQIEGQARINGQMVSHAVVPAEDMMQAFAYWHLVPAQELMVCARGAERARGALQAAGGALRQLRGAARPDSQLMQVEGGTVSLPAGGNAQVQVRIPRRPPVGGELLFELSEPPEGVTLQKVTTSTLGMTLMLKADLNAAAGPPDNLIVEAFTESVPRGQQGRAASQKRKNSVGFLPAIPYQVVKR